jgi:hypothetical protein
MANIFPAEPQTSRRGGGIGIATASRPPTKPPVGVLSYHFWVGVTGASGRPLHLTARIAPQRKGAGVFIFFSFVWINLLIKKKEKERNKRFSTLTSSRRTEVKHPLNTFGINWHVGRTKPPAPEQFQRE